MKTDVSIQDLLFGVDQVPIEAVLGTNGNTRRICIPGKKALVNQRTGHIVGVDSWYYSHRYESQSLPLA